MVYLSDVNKNGGFMVYWENDVYVGDIIVGDDGYFAYWPAKKNGYATSYFLRAIADKLDELNEKWDKIVRSDPAINGKD